MLATTCGVAAQSAGGVTTRAAQYVADYEAQLPTLVAEERYEQHGVLTRGGVEEGRSQVLQSEFGWVRLPRLGETIGVREVRAIDGEQLPGGPRLRRLLEHPPADPGAEIRAILAESARHNLGPDGRNFNFPTFALVYLRPDRVDRSSWRSTRRGRWVELRFTEAARGTVVRSAAGHPVQARGRFLVDATSGRVERAEIGLREVVRPSGSRARVTCDLTVTFADHPGLGLWVPTTMTEHYEREDEGERLTVHGRATYVNVRRYVATGRLLR